MTLTPAQRQALRYVCNSTMGVLRSKGLVELYHGPPTWAAKEGPVVLTDAGRAVLDAMTQETADAARRAKVRLGAQLIERSADA